MQQCFRPLEIAHPTLQVMVSTKRREYVCICIETKKMTREREWASKEIERRGKRERERERGGGIHFK